MIYVTKRTEKDEEGRKITRWYCPQCGGTVATTKVGELPELGEYCGHCGEELVLNPDDVIKHRGGR
ncbi:MAG: hypothetical protein Q4A32_03465 [Lachnospiraceae bacterium]|nr:hypothetical protein [Lachnospiraceae bacterium]